MGSATVQGDLWGKSPVDWANIQEKMHTPLWEAMLTAVNVNSGNQLLDAGCGGGGASVIAAKRGAVVTGIDAADELLQIAQERVPQGKFLVGDIEFLPFPDKTFDVVFVSNSIQYAENQIATLSELRRVCKADGKIVIALFSTPDKVAFSFIFKAIRDILPDPPSGGGPFALSEIGKLEGLIEQAGMTLLHQEEVNCPFEYQDFDIFWRANVSASPTQGIIRIVGEDTLKAAFQKATKPFSNTEGIIRIEPNMYRYLVASP